MARQGILELVQPDGVTKSSAVMWQRQKWQSLRFKMVMKDLIKGKVMDKVYPIRDIETTFMWPHLHGALLFVKINL